MNQAELIGRLTADPELKTTKKDHQVVHFFLAINRHFGKSKNGNDNEPQADFVPCVAWNGAAKCLAEHCVKGSRIGVRGPIRSRVWQAPDGQRKYVMEVRVDEFEFLEHPRKNIHARRITRRIIHLKTKRIRAIRTTRETKRRPMRWSRR